MKVSILTLSNSPCHFPNHKSVFIQILHDFSVLWTIIPLYFFRSHVILYAQKGLIKPQIFETFECLDQNSPNSCHFWNNKLVLQILHQSSVFWDITPLYFFSWNFIYFQQKASLWMYKFGEISLEKSTVLNFALWKAPFVKII